MDVIGSHIAQSAAGAPQASRVSAREKRREIDRKDDAKGRGEDMVDVPVSDVEQPEAARHVGANEDEDSHEDRRASGFYSPHANGAKPKGENLDLNA
jgi:hypothetical protein